MRIKFVSIRNSERKTSAHLTSINNTRLVNTNGFSVFEFIIVVAIFSALVSVLMPKFESFHDEAHITKVKMTANSLQTAVNLTHRLWQTYGSINNVSLLKGYGNNNVVMSEKGWPVNALFEHEEVLLNKKIRLRDIDSCENLWRGLLKETAPKVDAEIDWKVDDSIIYLAKFDQGICRYQYMLSKEELRIEYDLATGQVIPFF